MAHTICRALESKTTGVNVTGGSDALNGDRPIGGARTLRFWVCLKADTTSEGPPEGGHYVLWHDAERGKPRRAA